MNENLKQPKISPNPSLQKRGASHFDQRGTEGDFERRASQTHHSLAERIALQIENEHLEPRSKMSVMIEQIGYASLVLVSFVFIVLVINWIGFWLRASGLGDFVFYGPDGIQAFVESLPIVAILLTVIGYVGVMKALNHYDISYKHPAVIVGGVVLVGALVFGVWLAQTGINEELAERTTHDELPVLRPVYAGTFLYVHHATRSIVGPVVKLNPPILTVGLPEESVDVETNAATAYPVGKPALGDRVRILIIRREGAAPVARVILLNQPRLQLTPTPTNN